MGVELRGSCCACARVPRGALRPIVCDWLVRALNCRTDEDGLSAQALAKGGPPT
jgi:hypothetical protein